MRRNKATGDECRLFEEQPFYTLVYIRSLQSHIIWKDDQSMAILRLRNTHTVGLCAFVDPEEHMISYIDTRVLLHRH